MIDPNRKRWNEQMQQLQQALTRSRDHQTIIDMFLRQHAMVHASEVSQSGIFSFDDELWQDLSIEDARCVPPRSDHSIVWLMWHTTRCEDITMNLLVAGGAQVLHSGSWLDSLNITARDTGSVMSVDEIIAFSAEVDVPSVRAYRAAVGRRTREIAGQLPLDMFNKKVDPARLQRITDEGAVVDQARWLIDYWGGRTIAGLLTMPATRHNFVHLNEAMRLKQTIQKA